MDASLPKTGTVKLAPAGGADAPTDDLNIAPALGGAGGAAGGTSVDTTVVGLGADTDPSHGGGLAAGDAPIGAKSAGPTPLVASIPDQAAATATSATVADAAAPQLLGFDAPATGGQRIDPDAAPDIGGGSALGGTTLTYGIAGKLQIQVTYDLSVNSAPAGFQTGFEAAIGYFVNTFTNNAKISLNVGWGEVTLGGNASTVTGTDLGRSRWFFDDSSYAQIKGALGSHLNSADQIQAFSTLPVSDPLSGNYVLTTAQARALGIVSGSGEDGGVGFNSSDTYTFDPNNRAVGGAFDFVGIAEHEIAEVLGRDAAVGTAVGATSNAHFPMDLFRFTAAGTRATTSTTNPSYFSINSGITDLKNWNNAALASGDLGDWAATSPYTADAYNNISNSGIKNDVTPVDTELLNVVGYNITCFCRGTMILTDHGEVPVEVLAVGDRVVTLSGAVKPIVWIGMGRDLVTRANKLARPIIVRRGALAEGVPTRDLHLTHGHALYLDDVLIPVENLVNHRSIVWDETARAVEYYHIELEDHDVVLANGAAAESYYDANNRARFHNTRPGSQAGAAKPGFAPVLSGGELVDRVWSALNSRAGGSIESDTTDDPDLHLLADGMRRDAAQVDAGTYTFAFDAPPAGALRLCSRSGVPSLLGITRHDHRRLGVAITRIDLRQEGLDSTFAHKAPLFLEGGGHPAENGYCWTDGEFDLPAWLFAHLTGPFTLSVSTERPGMRYPAPPKIAAAA